MSYVEDNSAMRVERSFVEMIHIWIDREVHQFTNGWTDMGGYR